MIDPQNEQPSDTPETTPTHGAKPAAPKPAFQAAPGAPKRPAPRPTPSFEELAESKPTRAPVAPTEPKPTASTKAGLGHKSPSKQAPVTPDNSITFDEEPSGPNVGLLVVDAIAAAIAVAFTVLLVQDVLPFLK